MINLSSPISTDDKGLETDKGVLAMSLSTFCWEDILFVASVRALFKECQFSSDTSLPVVPPLLQPYLAFVLLHRVLTMNITRRMLNIVGRA